MPNYAGHSLGFFVTMIGAWIPMLLTGKWGHESKIPLAAKSKTYSTR